MPATYGRWGFCRRRRGFAAMGRSYSKGNHIAFQNG